VPVAGCDQSCIRHARGGAPIGGTGCPEGSRSSFRWIAFSRVQSLASIDLDREARNADEALVSSKESLTVMLGDRCDEEVGKGDG
jgi:hypothetical protein